jgi:exonuclease SbcC
MKPLVVEMQAFGPFADRQVIDFRELGSKTFFLIHGPTGSGKTSILDGICFALFGDSSGGEREGRHLRSHHADSDTLTQVSFDFALGADRYRVRRVPEQMRKSQRGGGETKQLQKADLWCVKTVDGKDIEQPMKKAST